MNPPPRQRSDWLLKKAGEEISASRETKILARPVSPAIQVLDSAIAVELHTTIPNLDYARNL